MRAFQERLQSVPVEMRRKKRYEIVSQLFFEGNPDTLEFARKLGLTDAKIFKIKCSLYARMFRI